MTATPPNDTRLIHQLAAYLCRAEMRERMTAIRHHLDPNYAAIRQASGRHELLRNLAAYVVPARG